MWIKVSCVSAQPNKNWQLLSALEGWVSFGMDLIKLAFDCLGRLPALADANAKYKCFRFDGHVSMLQLCAGIQADKYQDRSCWHWPKCRPQTEYTKPSTVVLVAWFRNRRVSQKLRPFLLVCSLPASLSALLGFPHGSGPGSEVTCEVFFLHFLAGQQSWVKAPRASQALQKCSFWHRSSWKSAKPHCFPLL